MARQLSLRRSLAIPPVGSEGMMTRAHRRRHLLAESSERLGLCQAQHPHPGASGERESRRKTEALVPPEWRDWAELLPPDLVEDISGRLLSLDVAEYLRFRTVCRPWRGLTADPHTAGLLDSRFRPRNWMVLSIGPDAEPHRRLLNLATAASLGVHLPALSSHCHICDADGLLVLFHKPTNAIGLLDPLTNAVTEFPAISSIVVAAPRPYSRLCGYLPPVLRNPLGVIPKAIHGACFDDSTSPPTLMLCLRAGLATIILAKPGDAHWTLVSPGRVSHPIDDRLRKVLFCTLLSMGGRCYIISPEGSVYLLELQPLPRLVEVVDQRRFAEADHIWCGHIISFLVAGTGGRMLMVRYWRGMERFGGIEAYNRKELFTMGGITSRIEVLEVDIAGRRLVPVRSLGRYAVFVGMTHCLHISTETFPSISGDTIYLGCLHQQTRGFSIYRINNKKKGRRTEPNHKFVFDLTRGFAPAARPCNLDEYLVVYVDRMHTFGFYCISIIPAPLAFSRVLSLVHIYMYPCGCLLFNLAHL
ncbi:hypothetical protein ACQ4PT_024331 [Festuca glaucescens]